MAEFIQATSKIQHSSWIDLCAGSLLKNLHTLQRHSGQTDVLAVIKANAYVGKRWLAVPYGGLCNTLNYREDWLKEAGYSKFPDTYEELREVVEHTDEVITEQPDSIINIVTKRKIPAINVKPLFKVGIAAAAIILIATAIFLNVPTAKATTLERIYKAIEKIRNVHISSFVPDKKEPVQEQWVSRTLNVNMIKSDKESVLYDVVNKAKKSKHLDSDLIETTILSAEMASRIQNTIDSSLGLLPFNSMSEIPKDAEWKRVDDKNVKIPNKIEVYDLVWVEKNYESHPVSKKWRFFVDPDTNLPQRLEIYQKSVTNDEYNLRYTIVVKYLDDSEMQKIVEKVSF